MIVTEEEDFVSASCPALGLLKTEDGFACAGAAGNEDAGILGDIIEDLPLVFCQADSLLCNLVNSGAHCVYDIKVVA